MGGTDLCVKLNYAQDEGPGKAPYLYTAPLTKAQQEATGRKEQSCGKTVEIDVTVRDGRNYQHSLDKHSFELVEQETALTTEDFFKDQEKVRSVYYPEIAELIKKNTGAAHVLMFHHQLRSKNNNATAETGTVSTIQPYAYGIHSDSHPKSARDLFKMMAGGLDKKYHKGRFLYINAWRNITDTPIGNDHLAVLDETTLVKPDDYIVAEFHDRAFSLQQYRLLDVNSAQHKWFYYSAMKKNEVLLFKQFDSDTSLSGRLCFHTAFHDPNAAECPERQSVEARGIAFFPDHEPNSCPEITAVQDQDNGEEFKYPSADDENRVKSKQLFDFKLDGVYDKEILADKKKNMAYAQSGNKMMREASKANDDGTSIANLMRGFMPYIAQKFQTKFFQEKEALCNHEEFKVPKDYGNDFEVPVLVHRPKSLNGKSAAILFAHGGGVIAGKAEHFKEYCSALALNTGVTVFNVDYRLAPETKCPDNIKDMYAALKHVVKNAEKFNIESEKIAIMGESGGGYICCGLEVMLAQKEESNLVKLAILSVAMVDDSSFGDISLMTREEKNHADIQKSFWNAIAVDLKAQSQDPLLYPGKASNDLLRKFPPTVIYEVEFDIYITETTRLARRLREAGRLLELVIQPGLGHGQATGPEFAKFHEAQDIIKKIIAGYLLD